MAPRNTGWYLLFAGFGLAGLGGLLLWRQRRSFLSGELGRGQLVTERHALTPKIDEYVDPATGMKVTHRRSAGMPIEERVASIQDLVWKSVADPEMRKLALAITRNCKERDGMCEAEAIYKAVKKRVRYTGDVAPLKIGGRNGPVEPVDLYQSAKRTWEFGGGDCDDMAILVSTLLTLNGITARLRVTAESKLGDWSHIYVVAGLPKLNPKKWVPIDATLPGSNKFDYEVSFAKNLDFPV